MPTTIEKAHLQRGMVSPVDTRRCLQQTSVLVGNLHVEDVGQIGLWQCDVVDPARSSALSPGGARR
eukprot:729730-Heterocapsa_arctica.AAC.1